MLDDSSTACQSGQAAFELLLYAMTSATARPMPLTERTAHMRAITRNRTGVAGADASHAPNKWLVLVLVTVAQFMVVLDATIVNVALPADPEGSRAGQANLQWVITAYTLVFGGFMLLGGRAGDLLGRKRLFWPASSYSRRRR